MGRGEGLLSPCVGKDTVTKESVTSPNHCSQHPGPTIPPCIPGSDHGKFPQVSNTMTALVKKNAPEETHSGLEGCFHFLR